MSSRALEPRSSVEPADDALVEGVGEAECDGEHGRGEEEPAAELVEVVDELRALAVAESAGEERHRS